jgi:hypothetical protein
VEDRQPNVLKQLFFLQAICNGATIAGTLLSFLSTKWWALAAFALAGTVVVQILLYRTSAKDAYYEFKDERDPNFVKFFAEWYDQNGRHDIYCKDLDWLGREELDPIVQVLIRRHASVSVFIREDDAEVCNRLRVAGVPIYIVPDVARSQMKMSLHTDDDDQELIIRRKAPDATTVRFIRSDDQYRLGLAEDLFTAYRKRASPSQNA